MPVCSLCLYTLGYYSVNLVGGWSWWWCWGGGGGDREVGGGGLDGSSVVSNLVVCIHITAEQWKNILMRNHLSFQTTFADTVPFIVPRKQTPIGKDHASFNTILAQILEWSQRATFAWLSVWSSKRVPLYQSCSLTCSLFAVRWD